MHFGVINYAQSQTSGSSAHTHAHTNTHAPSYMQFCMHTPHMKLVTADKIMIVTVVQLNSIFHTDPSLHSIQQQYSFIRNIDSQ